MPITEIFLMKKYATYTFVPSGAAATTLGQFPTFKVAVTLFVVVSITETVPKLVDFEFGTSTFDPSGVTANP